MATDAEEQDVAARYFAEACDRLRQEIALLPYKEAGDVVYVVQLYILQVAEKLRQEREHGQQ